MIFKSSIYSIKQLNYLKKIDKNTSVDYYIGVIYMSRFKTIINVIKMVILCQSLLNEIICILKPIINYLYKAYSNY